MMARSASVNAMDLRPETCPGRTTARGGARRCVELSPRQRLVFDGLRQGLLYKEIADSQRISVNTVKKAVGAILRKAEADNAREAIWRLGGN